MRMGSTGRRRITAKHELGSIEVKAQFHLLHRRADLHDQLQRPGGGDEDGGGDEGGCRVIVGEGDGEGEGDGDGLGDGDGDGGLDFLGFGFGEAEAEVGGDTGSGVVDAADGPGEAFFLSFGDADSDGDPEDGGGCSVTRCTAASG